MTRSIQSVTDWRSIRAELAGKGVTVGFVPTMGALHRGHTALVERCRAETDCTVVSIFVNPTQFNDRRDLEHYPRDLDADRALLEALGTDYLFLPEFDTIYPDGYRYRVTEDAFSRELCGASRPGHFDGVLTVVLRLLNIVRPTRAYFGEKDYQQYVLVRDMVRSLFVDVEIVPCPIVRDADGVALSSRNRRLSDAARPLAAEFARALREETSVEAVHDVLRHAGIAVDYIEEREGRRFGAVVIDGVRLIDNVEVGERQRRTGKDGEGSRDQ